MRVTGLVERTRHGAVRVFEEVEDSLTLSDLVGGDVGTLRRREPQGVERVFAEEGREGDATLNRIGTLRLGDERFRGVVAHKSWSELVDVLLERWDVGDDPLSSLVARARRDGRSARGALERMLRVQEQSIFQRKPPQVLPLWEVEELEQRLPAARTPRHAELHGLPTWSGCQVLVAPDAVEVDGLRVPRQQLVWVFRDHGEEQTLCLFDGSTVRLAQKLRDFGARALTHFNRGGTWLQTTPSDVAPATHLRARCLLRLPGRRSLERRFGGQRAGTRPRHSLLRRPGFLLDSRSPIPLTGEEPVLHDPALAAFVLARATDGIYVPTDPPRCAFVSDALPEEESVMILAEPRGAR